LQIVITASEFDAMAVHQSTGLPAVSLPVGVSLLPPELLPLLEPFDHIVLWLGGDMQSRQMAQHFATKLSVERCFLVRSFGEGVTLDSALGALNKELDMKGILNNAQPFQHKQILPFRKLREDVLSELANVDQVAGVKWRRFPLLSSIVKGHRPGELTIFTGPTGSGKTTLMSELSLDLCSQGVPTLWGSFEIKNVRLAKIMLRQLSNMNLEQNLNQFNYWADKMELLPMYFMGFYGSVDVKSVIDAMAHAAYVYDIRHVVIDNLQFMTGNIVR
jgi:twinkle protein